MLFVRLSANDASALRALIDGAFVSRAQMKRVCLFFLRLIFVSLWAAKTSFEIWSSFFALFCFVSVANSNEQINIQQQYLRVATAYAKYSKEMAKNNLAPMHCDSK